MNIDQIKILVMLYIIVILTAFTLLINSCNLTTEPELEYPHCRTDNDCIKVNEDFSQICIKGICRDV